MIEKQEKLENNKFSFREFFKKIINNDITEAIKEIFFCDETKYLESGNINEENILIEGERNIERLDQVMKNGVDNNFDDDKFNSNYMPSIEIEESNFYIEDKQIFINNLEIKKEISNLEKE